MKAADLPRQAPLYDGVAARQPAEPAHQSESGEAGEYVHRAGCLDPTTYISVTTAAGAAFAAPEASQQTAGSWDRLLLIA